MRTHLLWSDAGFQVWHRGENRMAFWWEPWSAVGAAIDEGYSGA